MIPYIVANHPQQDDKLLQVCKDKESTHLNFTSAMAKHDNNQLNQN